MRILLPVSAALSLVTPSLAAQSGAPTPAPQWGAVPAFFPAGALIAPVSGDTWPPPMTSWPPPLWERTRPPVRATRPDRTRWTRKRKSSTTCGAHSRISGKPLIESASRPPQSRPRRFRPCKGERRPAWRSRWSRWFTRTTITGRWWNICEWTASYRPPAAP